MDSVGILRRLCSLPLFISAMGASDVVEAQQVAAFRFNDLDLRDPHVFVDLIGCRDITDTELLGVSINGELQTRIQTDDNADGLLDLSYLVEFLPLDRTQATNLMDFGRADCSAPLAGTSCTPVTGSAVAGDAVLSSAGGACLEPISGTASSYTPVIATPPAPCFVSPVGTLSLDLGGVPIQLRDVSLGASFFGNPGDELRTGLLRGFISEADANVTMIPSDVPLIGGQPLSSLLPGGQGSCASHDARDLLNGVFGWWFYLNFTAPRVVVTDPFANGFSDGFEAIVR